MDLGIRDRHAVLWGMDDTIRASCRAALETEGVIVATGRDVPSDIVVAGWPGRAGSNILDVRTADELHRAWDAVESSVDLYRACLPSMEANEWGRFVWIGPASTKALDSGQDDLGAATSLAMLAVNKMVTSEAGARNVTANAILVGGAATADDVAATICFLCSEGAGYISGVTITVDGGAGSAMFP